MPKADDHQKLQEAFSFHQQGNLSGAANLYRQLIKRNPNNFQALHFLGVVEAGAGNIEQAKSLMARSLSTQPPNIQFIENYAAVLFQAGDYKSALQTCQQGLQINNRSASLLYVSAISSMKLNQLQGSLAQFDKLLSIAPTHVAALNERGSLLAQMKKYDAALASVEKALSLDLNYAEAHLNKGNIHSELQRYDEALASYDKALALKPEMADAWLGCGNVLRKLRRYDKADVAYDRALTLTPRLASAWLGRGNIFYEIKRYDDAVAAYDKALALKSDLAEAWLGHGNVFYDLKRYDQAFAAYDKAIVLKPDLTGVEGFRLHAKMHLCDWTNYSGERANLISSVRDGHVNTDPFDFLAISSSSDEQLQCARLWIANEYPASEKPVWQGERYEHDRIRIAYMSADFRDHAVGHLICGVLETHDKSRFETIALSLGPDDKSKTHDRIKKSFDTFVDVRSKTNAEIADLMRAMEIDIAIDLLGFTYEARTDVFARRSVPIQVNFLGYPGTLGADYFDYIIADDVVIPPGHEAYYTEKVVRLPDTYQANDSQRKISDRVPTRAQCGLPETGFVFCSFNNTFKITPDVFEIWMSLLQKTENSSLWLLDASAGAVRNLRQVAEVRGISSDRIVFAPRTNLEDHLARHKLADLFLDTLPYNAHTTASDALWAGVPIVTCLGSTFAGRVAASLLTAIGLPELITHSLEEYERLALKLANDPVLLAAMKEKVARNRNTSPLFDTVRFTRHIERAYIMMHERYRSGEHPASFRVEAV